MTRLAPQIFRVLIMTKHTKPMSAHSHHLLLWHGCQRTTPGRHREQLGVDMTTRLVVPNDLQAHAKWSTGLYKLDASDGKDSHSGITVAWALLFYGKCWMLKVMCWLWMVWELLYWSQTDDTTWQFFLWPSSKYKISVKDDEQNLPFFSWSKQWNELPGIEKSCAFLPSKWCCLPKLTMRSNFGKQWSLSSRFTQ